MKRWLLPMVAAALAGLGLSCAPRDENAPPPPEDPFRRIEAKKKETPAKNYGLLDKRIEAALENVARRDLLTTHAFWTIFHGILGMGPDIQLLEPESGKRVRALDLIAEAGKIRGLEFAETPYGLDVITMPGSGTGQGHQDQFIAEMAQWGMPLDHKFTINGKGFTFADFTRHCKMRASTTKKQELSWAIVIVSKYYGTDHRWTNMYGEEISLEDIARYEVQEPIESAACGGTHRLWGLSWAYHLHLAAGGKTEGVWKEVADHLEGYKLRAKQYRNAADGSFSSNYVSGPGSTRDEDRRINTTGHVFEWLALALTDEELRQPWVEEAASALSVMILENRTAPIDGGSLYHAAHGLHIYRQRVFGVPGPRGLTIPLPPAKKG